MCLATAFGKVSLINHKDDEVVLDKIARVEVVEGNSLKLVNFFGEEKSIKAKIKEIDFANSKIILEKNKD